MENSEDEDKLVSEEEAVEEVAGWMDVTTQALKIWLATGVRWTGRTLWQLGKAGVIEFKNQVLYGDSKYRR